MGKEGQQRIWGRTFHLRLIALAGSRNVHRYRPLSLSGLAQLSYGMVLPRSVLCLVQGLRPGGNYEEWLSEYIFWTVNANLIYSTWQIHSDLGGEAMLGS